MQGRSSRILWSVLLIVGGAIALLFNLDAWRRFEPLVQYIVSATLALAGVAFFVTYAASRQWWRLIPGWTLLSLAMMVLLSVLRPNAGRWVAALLLWGMALAFVHILLLERKQNWWALLPGGFMAVLGLVVALSGSIDSQPVLGALLFCGMGLVFVLLFFVEGEERQWWALIPGTVLVLFGLFILTPESAGLSVARWWPLAVVIGGFGLLWWSLRPQGDLPIEVNRAPAAQPAPAAQKMDAESSAAVQVLSDPER